MTEGYEGNKFFVRRDGLLYLTPLMVVLILVEVSVVVFALDSIPAIFAITTDPFIVYTSNVFAILGLRALYFALVGIIHRFKGNIDVKHESILNKGPDLVWPSMRDAHRALIVCKFSE